MRFSGNSDSTAGDVGCDYSMDRDGRRNSPCHNRGGITHLRAGDTRVVVLLARRYQASEHDR